MSLHYLTTPFKLECCEAQQDWPPPTRNPDGNSTACSHSTSVPHITRLPFRRSIVRFARTQLCGHLFATLPPTWPRNHLLLVQRPGRQPFSKRHTHRPGLPAPHTFSPSLYFLLLLSAMDSATSSERGFMQAITLLSLLLPLHRNLAEHTLTLLFTYYIIYCHVSWKPKTLLRHFRCRLSHYSTRACYFSLFSKAFHCKENC